MVELIITKDGVAPNFFGRFGPGALSRYGQVLDESNIGRGWGNFLAPLGGITRIKRGEPGHTLTVKWPGHSVTTYKLAGKEYIPQHIAVYAVLSEKAGRFGQRELEVKQIASFEPRKKKREKGVSDTT